MLFHLRRETKRRLTHEEKIRALREKIAQKQSRLRTYILKGNHPEWYEKSLRGQAADFEYFIKELDRMLVDTDLVI